MKPKLCLVVPSYSETDASHFSYLRQFAKRLSRDFDLALLIERGHTPRSEIKARETILLRFTFIPLRFLETLFQCARLRTAGYKNFYIHYSFLAAYCASLTHGKVFYWNCGEPWKFRRSSVREWFERLVYRRIDYLVTGTEGLAARYRQHYQLKKEKTRVMPNWTDVAQFSVKKEKVTQLRKQLDIGKDEKVVLFVHRLSKRKGAQYLPEILKGLEGATLLVIGEGPGELRLKSAFARENLGERVRLLGAVPNHALPPYYALADLFIMPSDEEGYPHVLLEAMAAGVPFVASNVGGVSEIVPPQLLRSIVASGNVKEFVKKARDALRLTAQQRNAMSKTATAWVREHNSLESSYKLFPVPTDFMESG